VIFNVFSVCQSGFITDIDNWIIWIPGFKGYWEPDNIKRVVSQGVEFYLSVKGSFGRFNYLMSGNYAFTSSLNYGDPLVWGDESYGKQLPYIPRHSGNFLAKLSFMKFFINWQHNSYSERFTTSSNDVTRRDRLYPYYMNDLGIGKEFAIKKVSFRAEFKIYNLLNEAYHTVLYRPMPGRNFLFTLMIKY
jgi:iron complex outermembrane receptor protein